MSNVRYSALEKPSTPLQRARYTNWVLAIIAFLLLVGFILALTLGLTLRDPKPCETQCNGVTIGCDEICTNYIVVGSGTAGTAVAYKLSENGTFAVVVLEAGDNYINDDTVQNVGDGVRFEPLPFQEPFKYHFSPITQTVFDFASEIYGRVTYANGGRLVGGSSHINDMWQVRGSVEYWTELQALLGGDPKFDPDSVYEVYKQIEWLKPSPNVYTPDATRGTDGTWKLETIPTALDLNDDTHIISQTMAGALGITNQLSLGYNDPAASIGAFPNTDMLYDFNNTSPRKRWSSQHAFLDASVVNQQTLIGVAPRRLQVRTRSTVRRLLFHPNIPTKVIGVEYSDGQNGNQIKRAYVTNEVILSAFYHDAMILQRSGVGPSAVLQNAGIAPVAINENVGQNWKQHPLVGLAFLYSNLTGVNSVDAPILSGLGNVFVEDSVSGSPGQRGYHMISASFPSVMVFFDFQLRQQSFGNISIYTNDLNQEGRIVTGVNSNAVDLESWRAHLREVVLGVLAFDPNIVFLSFDNTTLYDDNLLNQWIIRNILPDGSANHNFGSCQMGVNSTYGAIDTDFRVRGITNARVCDTQSFPRPTDGNPSYPAAALGIICGNTIAGVPPPQPPAKKRRRVEKAVTKKTPPKPRTHSTRAMTSQEEYNAMVTLFEKIKMTMSPGDATQLVANLKEQAKWKELCALYC